MKDGHVNKCKECNLKDVHGNYQNNILDPKYMTKERARGREKFHRLYANPAKRVFTYDSKERWIKENPEKRKAQIRVGNALRNHTLIKSPCSVCGSTVRIHGHHEDYSKPLEVLWLCPKHHHELHLKKQEVEKREANSFLAHIL